MIVMDNKRTTKGVHYTRYIMSWVRAGGSLRAMDCYWGDFARWLQSVGCTSDEIREIVNLAGCGKFELECSVRDFAKSDQ